MTRQTITLLATIAGGALSANAAEPAMPELAPRGTMPSRHIAHIYYNIATGEKVATLLSDTRPAESGISPEVWIADNTLPCADFGQQSPVIGVIDDPIDPVFMCTTCTGSIVLDWGDIPVDTVVDCVGITWSTQHQDTDLDGDGVGDGVAGFGATWAWFDAENGYDSSATRLDLTSFSLSDLPGDHVGQGDPNVIATYTATIDLAESFTSSIVFEIGDTDSLDAAGTGIFNPGAGADLDSDGLADFGYAMQFIQPGTADFDGDGVPDGDPSAEALTGWTLVTGNGAIASDGSYIPETDVPGAIGIEDAFDLLFDADDDGVLEPIGTFFYGGFRCLGATGNTPFAQFYMKLYGPRRAPIVDCGDYFPPGGGDGLLNFFDVALYLNYFNSQNPLADVFPGDGDGVFNFFDINAFLTTFAAGCP